MASEGLEPPTLCSEDRCSNPLSYKARLRFPIVSHLFVSSNSVAASQNTAMLPLRHVSRGEPSGNSEKETPRSEYFGPGRFSKRKH